MSKINERQVALRTNRAGLPVGTFKSDLNGYLDNKKVVRTPYNETQGFAGLTASMGALIANTLVPVNANYADNLLIALAGDVSVANHYGIVAGTGTFTAGTFAADRASLVTDISGNILNMVALKYADSNDPILDLDGREVYGVIVAAAGVADGNAIAANPAENLQITFAVVSASGTLAAPNGGVTGDVEFQINRLLASRYEASIKMEGGVEGNIDVIADLRVEHFGLYTVTTGTTAGASALTLSNGNLTNGGASTRSGDAVAVTLPAAGDLADNKCKVLLNGVIQNKVTDVSFTSAGVLQVAQQLDIADEVSIIRVY